MVGVAMHMSVLIIVWLVSFALSAVYNHNSCFNDSSNLSAPTDGLIYNTIVLVIKYSEYFLTLEYALITFVSHEIRRKQGSLWRFTRIETAGIPSTNRLYSATLQGSLYTDYHDINRPTIYGYPIMTLLMSSVKNTLISLSSDFKSIHTCLPNGLVVEEIKEIRLTNRGATSCNRSPVEDLNCISYGFHNPESSECVEREFSLNIQHSYHNIKIMFDIRNQRCYAGIRRQTRSKYLFITCTDEMGHVITKQRSIDAIRMKKAKLRDERLVLVGNESELYYLARHLKVIQLSKIFVKLDENELQIDLKHPIAEVPLTSIHDKYEILEGPSDTNKLMIALLDIGNNIYRIMSPWDRTFAYNTNWTNESPVRRRPAKLVPICGKTISTAVKHTKKPKQFMPLLLTVCLIGIGILCIGIGLGVLAVKRRRNYGNTLDNSKITNKNLGSVNKTRVTMLKKILGLTFPSCSVVRETENQSKTDQPKRAEPITDGSTIKAVDNNEVSKDRYTCAEERRINRLQHSNVGTLPNLRKSKSNFVTSSDVITITRRSDQYTKRSTSVQSK